MIQLKRVYDEPGPHDGLRFLVERLWPRGIRKTDLRTDGWEKEAGPSTQLRKWFGHDPKKWEEFQRKYFAELDTRPEAWEPILKAAERGTITLLYSSHDGSNKFHEYARTGARNDSKGCCGDVPRSRSAGGRVCA